MKGGFLATSTRHARAVTTSQRHRRPNGARWLWLRVVVSNLEPAPISNELARPRSCDPAKEVTSGNCRIFRRVVSKMSASSGAIFHSSIGFGNHT